MSSAHQDLDELSRGLSFLPTAGQRETTDESAQRETEAIKAKMAAPETLNLPEKLERRRLEFGITDGAFRKRALFERVLIHQIPSAEDMGETFGGGLIYKPDTSRDREERQAPCGIIVSAGLRALDILWSNGVELGDIITFIHCAPFHIPCDYVHGQWRYLINLNVGDLLADEDLALAYLNGSATEQFDGEKHRTVFLGDTVRRGALTPWISDDVA